MTRCKTRIIDCRLRWPAIRREKSGWDYISKNVNPWTSMDISKEEISDCVNTMGIKNIRCRRGYFLHRFFQTGFPKIDWFLSQPVSWYTLKCSSAVNSNRKKNCSTRVRVIVLTLIVIIIETIADSILKTLGIHWVNNDLLWVEVYIFHYFGKIRFSFQY